MLIRPAVLLRLGLPAALVAVVLTPMGGAPVSAAQPEPYHSAFSAPGRSSDSGKATYAPNSVLVKFRKSASAAARQKALSKHQARSAAATTGDYAKVTGDAAAPALLKQLKAEPSVELASLSAGVSIRPTRRDDRLAILSCWPRQTEFEVGAPSSSS